MQLIPWFKHTYKVTLCLRSTDNPERISYIILTWKASISDVSGSVVLADRSVEGLV